MVFSKFNFRRVKPKKSLGTAGKSRNPKLKLLSSPQMKLTTFPQADTLMGQVIAVH